MANNKSARKRIVITGRNRAVNKFYLTSVRTLIKKFYQTIESYIVSKSLEILENAKRILSSIYSLLDKGCKKHIFHKNNVARKKARLSAVLQKCL